MRKIFLILLLVPTCSFGQKKIAPKKVQQKKTVEKDYPVINIGPLTVGETTEDSLSSILKISPQQDDVEGYSWLIIPNYKYKDLVFGRTELLFHYNVLIKVTCDYSDLLKQILETKYGKGKSASQEEEDECEFPISHESLKYKRTIYSTSWQGKNCIATGLVVDGRDRDCNKSLLTGFFIENQDKVIKYEQLAEALKKKAEDRLKAARTEGY